jgi:hypothetical protein
VRRSGPGEPPAPILAALPLYRDAGWVADLDPDRTGTGSIGAVYSLGDDALGAKPASVGESSRAIFSDVFIEQDAGRGPETATPARERCASSRVSVAEGCMCLIAYLILGLIAGWFVASQGVGNSGASDFRHPPPQIFRPPSHPRQSLCPHRKLYVPRSISPEILEPVRGQSRVNRSARDRTVSEPSLNRPGIGSPVRQRIANGITA